MLKTELRKIFNNKILLLSIFVILFVPILYAGIFLKAVWNPQSHTDQLLVGVVNQDKTVEFEGKKVDIGHQLVEHLKDNQTVNWQFVSEDKAQQELKGGDYYMVVTIPDDFSKNATTMSKEHPEKMKLYFETNHTKSKSAENVMLTVSDKVTDNIKEQVIKAYTDTMAQQFSKLGKNLSQASDGASKISDGLIVINDKMPILSSGVNQLTTGAGTLNSGLTTYTDGVNTLSQGLNQANSSIINELNPATQKLLQGFNQAESGQQQLMQGSQKLNEGQQQFNNKFGELNNHLQQLPQATEQLVSAASQLDAGSHKLNDSAQALLSGQQQLRDGLAQFGDKQQQFSAGMTNLNQGISAVLTGEQSIQQGLNELLNQAQAMQQKFKVLSQSPSMQNITQLLQGVQALQQSQAPSDVQNTLASIQQNMTNMANYHQAMLDNLMATDTFQALNSDQQHALIASLNQSYQSLYANELNTVSQNFTQLVQQLQDNAAQYQQFKNGINQLNVADMGNLTNSLPQVEAHIDQAVEAISKLKEGQDQIVQATSQLSSGATTLSDGSMQLSAATIQLNEGANKLTDSSHQYVNEGTQVLQDNMALFNQKVSQLPSSVDALSLGSQKLADASAQLVTGQQTLFDGLTTYTSGVGQLVNGFTQYSQGIDKLGSGVSQLSEGSEKLADNSPKLLDGGQQLANGLMQLDNQLPQLTNGLQELGLGADKLTTGLSTGADKLNQVHITSANTDMLADPVISTISDVTGKEAKYGELMAPYFLALGLYIGAMIFNLIYPVTLPSMQPTSAGAWWRSKLAIMTGFVTLEVVIELIVMSTLFNMTLAHPLLYAIGLFVIAYAFMLLIHFLVFTFDNPGRFIAMVLLILQLSSSGGMFPVEMTPHTYQWLSSFMPMYYALAVLRHAILGGLTSDIYYSSLIVLIIIIVVSMILTYLIYRIKTKKTVKPLQMI